MMMTSRGRTALHLVLVAFGLLLLGLSVDVMVRVHAWRARFDSPLTAGFLLALEALRILTILVGLTLAAAAARRAARAPGLANLGTAAALLTIAAATALAGPLPGAGQEALARALLDAGIPQRVLAFVFVRPEWAAWLAAAPLLSFAAAYPRPLTSDDVLASGGSDRAGALRSVAVAGTDIGQLARSATARVLGAGLLTPGRLWPAAAALAMLHAAGLLVLGAGARLALQVVTAVAVAAVLGLLVTLLRAGRAVAGHEARAVFAGGVRGALTALGLLAAAAVAELVPGGSPAASLLLGAAPPVLFAATLHGVVATGRPISATGRPPVRR